MPNLTPEQMAERLTAGRLEHSGPVANTLSDPIADTPMIVTLDQVRPYNLNPRVTRNPRYDELKASIRVRYLDSPPPITRRPGEEHFIIRNGGNTRLSILNELWSETKDEKFFRIMCLFRPWSQRGEIVSLTGHLCENELHGRLSFIERALGIEKARELYELEHGSSISQRELARRLTQDGYPIAQSHISRMQDAVRYLLPSIPNVLYGGLGKPQIERLIGLRQAALRSWERHAATKSPQIDFLSMFSDLLVNFDVNASSFTVERVQDELIGQMSDIFGIKYDLLALEIVDVQSWQQLLAEDPNGEMRKDTSPPDPASDLTPKTEGDTQDASDHAPRSSPHPATAAKPAARSSQPPSERLVGERSAHPSLVDESLIQAHTVSAPAPAPRVQLIQRAIADATGEDTSTFSDNVVRAVPVQAGGLHPVSDVWFIDPSLESPARLRAHIAQLAVEVAAEVGQAARVESSEYGIGFRCVIDPQRQAGARRSPAGVVIELLSCISSPYIDPSIDHASPGLRFIDELPFLLFGSAATNNPSTHIERLSDVALVKLFRMIRLGRRLLEMHAIHS